MWSWWGLCPLSRVFVGIDNTSVFVLRFLTLRWVSPLLFIGLLQSIAAGIGTSDFLRAASIVNLNSSSFVRLSEEFSSQYSVVCEFFYDSPFLFSLHRVSISKYLATHRQEEVTCFFVSLLPGHVHPSRCFSCSGTNLVNPAHASDNSSSIHVAIFFDSFLQQYTQWCKCCSGNVDVLHRSRKRFFSACAAWLWVQRDDDKWILLWSSRSHF